MGHLQYALRGGFCQTRGGEAWCLPSESSSSGGETDKVLHKAAEIVWSCPYTPQVDDRHQLNE